MDNYLAEFGDTFGQLILLWLSQLRDICAEEDVTPTEKRLLYGLFRFPKLTKKELAKIVVLEQSSVSRALDSLELRGYVARITSPSDRRYIQLSLTSSGLKKTKAIKKKALQKLKILTANIPAGEINKVTATLKKLNSRL